jgi:hypothetical protein
MTALFSNTDFNLEAVTLPLGAIKNLIFLIGFATDADPCANVEFSNFDTLF